MNPHYWPMLWEHLSEADWVTSGAMQTSREWRDEGQEVIMRNRRKIDALATFRERIEYCAENNCLANLRHVMENLFDAYSPEQCHALVMHGFMHACKHGSLALVKHAYMKGEVEQEIVDVLMKFACAGGQLEIINYLQTFYPYDANEMLIAAARGGHGDLVRRYIDEGATVYLDALIETSARGHVECAMYLKGKVDVSPFVYVSALQSGNEELVKQMVNHDIDPLHVLKAAAYGGVWSIVCAADNDIDWDEPLIGAVLGDQLEVVKYIIALRGTHELDDVFIRVRSVGMFEYFLSIGSYTPSQGMIDTIFMLACQTHVIDMIDRLLPDIENPVVLASGWMSLYNSPYVEVADLVYTKWKRTN